MVGPTRHGVRLYALIVGKTARARKGDSWQFPAALMRRADPDWFEQCVTTGMSTGEGLIAAVRDAVGDGESAPPDRRVLAGCAQRPKQLPGPEPVAASTFDSLAQRVRVALERARLTLALQRDEETRALWTALYPTLTEDRNGLAGDVLARSEAQVLRLSMVHALLDCSKLIRREHLLAAVAVWDYCAASVLHLSGDASGDAVADDILRHLATAGELTRTDLSNRLGRNVPSNRLRLALDTLERGGQATRRTEKHAEGGRPTEVWKATGPPPAADADE